MVTNKYQNGTKVLTDTGLAGILVHAVIRLVVGSIKR